MCSVWCHYNIWVWFCQKCSLMTLGFIMICLNWTQVCRAFLSSYLIIVSPSFNKELHHKLKKSTEISSENWHKAVMQLTRPENDIISDIFWCYETKWHKFISQYQYYSDVLSRHCVYCRAFVLKCIRLLQVLFLWPPVAVLLIMLEVELTEYLTKEQSFSDSNACIHTTLMYIICIHVMSIHIHDFFKWFFLLALPLFFSPTHTWTQLKKKTISVKQSSSACLLRPLSPPSISPPLLLLKMSCSAWGTVVSDVMHSPPRNWFCN